MVSGRLEALKKQESPIVLLVEDNPDHADMIQSILMRSGLVNTIYTVTNGEDALNYLYRLGVYRDREQSPRPNMILLDIKLPRMDGLEVLRQIKRDESLKSIPVVLLSTCAEKREIATGYMYGANSYVTKSFEYEEFMNQIKNIGLYWLITNTSPKLENNNHTN